MPIPACVVPGGLFEGWHLSCSLKGHKEGGPAQRRKDPGNEKGSVKAAQRSAHLRICRERRQMELGRRDGASKVLFAF